MGRGKEIHVDPERACRAKAKREMDPAQVYGHRPKHEDVWFLSPY